MDPRPATHVNRALITFALLLFSVSELDVITSLWSVPNGTLTLGILTKYILPFLISLPMLAAVKGFYSVKRRILATDYDTVDELSRQFLTTVIMSYAAIIFMVSALQV